MNTAKPTGGIGAARPMRPADAEPDSDIGTLPLSPEADRAPERMVPRQAPPESAYDPRIAVLEQEKKQHTAVLINHTEAIDRLEVTIGQLGVELRERDERIAQLNQALAQAQSALDNHAQHLMRQDARINAMAQQIARNVRLAAADVVFKTRSVGDTTNNLMKAVREVYGFFMEPEPQPEQPEEPQPGSDAAPERLN